jgi:hypothetical protein
MNKCSKLKEWDAALYDGLRGMPPDWIPEESVIRFIANRDKIEYEILNDKLSISEAFSRLKFYISKEQLWRREDELLELHKDEEALKITKLLQGLKFPIPNHLDYIFDYLAKFHEDIQLGQEACLNHWLGKEIARNISVGKAQRNRSADGGIRSGELRRKFSQHGAIKECAKRLRQAGEPRRGLASRIKDVGGFSLTIRQINHILRNAEIK